MFKRVFFLAILITLLLGATPARATTSGGWVPAPSAPFDAPAGTRCDFAVHAEPVLDEVKTRVLARYPDGSTKREAYVGDLIFAVTNLATSRTIRVDIGGSALVDYARGGTLDTNSTWHLVGPAMFGFRENGGNRPRGIYVFDGVFRIAFDATGVKTVTRYQGIERNLCEELGESEDIR